MQQKNKSGHFVKTAICKINDGYAEYSKRQYHSVVSIDSIVSHLPKFIGIADKNEAGAILDLLPQNNKNLSHISIANVQDLCTALEVEYDLCDLKRKKDPLIKELKDNIKTTIELFLETNAEIDIYKQTTISSAFQYLDYSLKEKIFFLYNQHKCIFDALALRWSCPELTLENIGAFVKLRNSKTHSGTIEEMNGAEIYLPLFALAYVCLFARVGLTEEEVENAISKLFY